MTNIISPRPMSPPLAVRLAGLILSFALSATVQAQGDDSDALDALFEDSAPAESEDPDAANSDDGADEADEGDEGDRITLPEPELDVPAQTAPRRATLEEIVVTAQKRAQSLTDVPISVSAVTGEKLRDAGIENLIDLSEYAPNFKLVDGGLVPLIYMRGVGSGSNQGFEMSVGLYNDGIHLGRPHQTLPAFLDVERVEVLKGPQSILFGKNSVAGALNITSAKPQQDFASTLSGSWFGPDSDRELNGFVTGGLTSSLAGRFAFRLRKEGGYLDNLSQDRREPGLSEQAYRGSLAWEPDADIELIAKIEHSERTQHGRAYQVIDRGILNESAGTTVGLDDIRDTDGKEIAFVDSDSITITANMGLWGGELVSVSGYGQFEQFDRFDADSSRIDTILLDGAEDYSQFSQEVRWVSPAGETLDYIVGAFYQHADQEFNEFGPLKVRSGTIAMVGAPPESLDTLAQAGEANLVTVVSADLARLFTVKTDSWSAFAQATWNFGLNWRTTAGLRFVSEHRKGARIFNAYQPGTQDPVDPVTAQALSQLLIEEHELYGKRTSNLLLPMINLQRDIGDDIMVYGSWSRGAKSGGYDARNNNAQDGPTGGGENFEYEDEIADAFELGSKLRLLDNSAELNISLYHVLYDDMQVSVFDGVAGFTVTNAGSARVQGVELDGRWRAHPNVLLSGSLAYLDFEWQKYRDGPCYFGGPEGNENGTCDLTGEENQQTPNWSASLSTSLLGEFSFDLGWSATLDVNFRDDYFTSGDLDPRGLQDGYVKYNLRLALEDLGQKWAVALVGKNLSDEISTGIGAPVPLDTGGYMITGERPRSYGIELRYSFD